MLLNREISSFEDYFWTYNQTFKSLMEYRQEIASGWDDNASKDVNNRFLNPHGEDSENSIAFFKEQINNLREMNNQLTIIESLIEKVNAISREIEILFNYANIDIKKSYYSLNTSIEKRYKANHWIDKTKKGLKELKELKKAHNMRYS